MKPKQPYYNSRSVLTVKYLSQHPDEIPDELEIDNAKEYIERCRENKPSRRERAAKINIKQGKKGVQGKKKNREKKREYRREYYRHKKEVITCQQVPTQCTAHPQSQTMKPPT